ncbi:NAD(P)-binding protein [Basidiobolus meristosporus CBS 931.73]|uniref:NAD(P)-binding protein n=1 Tax=Basidiobolus meristosporus CBS 931.73 TaxID=1314790 RepID=A0A1Y1XVD7_9FUNG|nr:NAD(P)-binding protein [Basidiobolus meristosporus CBS 931.73]|eukprot:ORX89732.1 NAD(P)-binding protein [Basidiobolus meristosporus CBS 931.73]
MVYNSIRDLALSFFVVGLAILQIPVIFALTFFDILQKIVLRRAHPRQIVITGGSSDIGEALALEYAQPGVILHLVARSQSRLKAVEEKCKRLGCTIYVHTIDVADNRTLQKTLLDIYKDRPIDLLIAGAGQVDDFLDTDEDHGLAVPQREDMYSRTFDMNVIGIMNTVMPIFNIMKNSGYGGQIAIIGSASGFIGSYNMVFYNATKAALNTFARDLRYLGQECGIKINLIVPGLIKSPLNIQDTSFPRNYPIFGSIQILAQVIKSSLSQNEPIISYPNYQFIGVYGVGALVPTVQQWITWSIGLFKPQDTKII